MRINVRTRSRQSAFRNSYAIGVQKALILGYKRVEDVRAFNGEYYIKNGKKWIFFLESLAHKIGACCYNDFSKNGYAIEDYKLYGNMSIEEMVVTVFGENSPEYREHCHEFGMEDVYDDYADYADDAATVMRGIYEMNDFGDGDDAYIGDGVWVSSDGSYRCR